MCILHRACVPSLALGVLIPIILQCILLQDKCICCHAAVMIADKHSTVKPVPHHRTHIPYTHLTTADIQIMCSFSAGDMSRKLNGSVRREHIRCGFMIASRFVERPQNWSTCVHNHTHTHTIQTVWPQSTATAIKSEVIFMVDHNSSYKHTHTHTYPPTVY